MDSKWILCTMHLMSRLVCVVQNMVDPWDRRMGYESSGLMNRMKSWVRMPSSGIARLTGSVCKMRSTIPSCDRLDAIGYGRKSGWNLTLT
jgi:hypothetical protein